MKENGTLKMVAIGLGVAAVALVMLLIYRGHAAAAQHDKDQAEIVTYSNSLTKANAELDENKQVITNLETDLTARKADILSLSNTLATTTANLNQTQDALTNAQAEIAKRDETIAKLETQNKELEAEAGELTNTIAALNVRIQDTIAKLDAAEGDKLALSNELKRLTREKAELERKFNDITALRDQIKKIKHDLNIERRLDRISEGLPASSELHGGQKQMNGLRPTPPKPRHYDLNVEVNSDGSVKVIPPLNGDAPANK